MELSREYLEAQLKELQAKERQAFANFNAAHGAAQFCEHLLAQLGEAEESPKGSNLLEYSNGQEREENHSGRLG